jgi:preprotein translocase subunit YajC
MLISNAWAQTAPVAGAGASLTGTIIQLVLILLVFYLLLIRPQQKKMKEHEAELRAVKVGDRIVTGGGLYAKVTHIDGEDLTAEIAHGVEVKMYRYTVREVLHDEKAVTENKKSAEPKNTGKHKK